MSWKRLPIPTLRLIHSSDRSSAHFHTGCGVGGVKEGGGFKGVVNLVIYSVSLQYLSPGWWMKVADWWLHHPGPWLVTGSSWERSQSNSSKNVCPKLKGPQEGH